jgi:hypothetical protein
MCRRDACGPPLFDKLPLCQGLPPKKPRKSKRLNRVASSQSQKSWRGEVWQCSVPAALEVTEWALVVNVKLVGLDLEYGGRLFGVERWTWGSDCEKGEK